MSGLQGWNEMKSDYTMRRTVFLLLLLSIILILSGTVYADPCSDFFGRSGVTIGIIGASNDVSQSYDAFLKQLCPETTFVNKAVGSASPQKQLAEQLPHFLTNPVDLLIINPSGNGVCDATGGYKEAVKDILFRVKDQSPDTKTVLLTVSPRAGAAGQNNDCVKKFNTEVLTTTNEYNADFIVDIYPILEDPLGSGYCGYCGADRLHWTRFGDKRVALTIFYNVFKGVSPPAEEMSTPPAGGATKGTPSATTEPTAPPATTPLISQNCNNQQRCKEIDEAWLKLGLKGNQVWVPGKGWYDKAQVYATTTSGLTTTSGKEISVTTIKGKEFTVAGQKGECRAQFGTPERRALLDTISWAEGAGDYNIMFGGKVQQDLSQHPIYTGEMPPQGFPFGTSSSTAAGRYQFLKSTYDDLTQNGYFSTGFWPPEQDQAALYLAYQKRGLTDAQLSSAIQMGNFVPVWDQLAREWASLPYSKEDCSSNSCTADCKHKTKGTQCGFGKSYYGQGGRALSSLQEVFTTCLQYHNLHY